MPTVLRIGALRGARIQGLLEENLAAHSSAWENIHGIR
jgi:hypothetical protein